ncbi:MAG: 4-alpha-glucanotransferase [Actinomycetaceae bacterium]|nr:4-alpha-glucanotransferase [Actinomycetaceae bacterium]
MDTGELETIAAHLNRDLLEQLAEVCGVATSFWSYTGIKTTTPTVTLLRILQSLGSHVTCDDDIRHAIQEVHLRKWRRVLPPCIVMRNSSDYYVHVHIPHGSSVELHIECEDGSCHPCTQVEDFTDPRYVDGVLLGQATFRIPDHLPIGWHQLHASGDQCGTHSVPVAVSPEKLEVPPLRNDRAWGVMAQLYSVRSIGSWGNGDAADLADLGVLCADNGADFLLINPVHADYSSAPLNPSPYLPTSRTLVNPLYIRPERIPESFLLSQRQRKTIEKLSEESQPDTHELIDRDRSWTKKKAALELIYALPRSYARQKTYEKYASAQQVQRFALWSALVEKYGAPLPKHLTTFASEGVAGEAETLKERIGFFTWLQWVASEQLSEAQDMCIKAGMRIGVMHDLAVGVDPYGADPWMYPELYAEDMTVGAPADMYNQLGQNWSQPPWRPDALEESAYAPLRAIVQRLARMGGALRIDHIMGLFRLWWIPQGVLPAEGTYVRYNYEAMVGILLLEAWRAGVMVIGEDLGTVEPGVREYLQQRGIFGTGVFWFEQHNNHFIAPENYRQTQLATVTTHDLPPTAGYLQDVHVSVRQALGLLETTYDQAREQSRAERIKMLTTLCQRGLIGEDVANKLYDMNKTTISTSPHASPTPTPCTAEVMVAKKSLQACSSARGTNRIDASQLAMFTQTPPEMQKLIWQVIRALHQYVASTPATLVAMSLTDAVMENRAQNQPGTDREYPNWCVPLGNAQGHNVLVEELVGHQGFLELCELMERIVHPR